MITQTEKALIANEDSALIDFMLSGGTIKDLLSVPERNLEAIYTYGYQQYNAGHYDVAEQCFSLLFSLSPYEYRFIHALAAVLQTTKRYREALKYYLIQMQQTPNDPEIQLRCVECFIQLNEKAVALEWLNDLLAQDNLEKANSAIYLKAKGYSTLLTPKHA